MKQSPLNKLKAYDIILASGSPRRRELLGMLDIDFRVDTSRSVDEKVPEDLPVEEVAPYLSALKSSAYPIEPDEKKLVITADTIVLLDGEVLGKPRDKADAIDMLLRLQGRKQKVITGVTVKTSEKTFTFSAESAVEFAALTKEEIEYYVDRYSPLDKAGAYGIQEWIGAAGIKGIEGSFYNVMGLPVQRLYTYLKEL